MPGISFIFTRSKELVMVPVPVLWKRRRSERESGKMKPDPRTSIIHIFPESQPLGQRVRSAVKKNYYLVTRQKGRIHIIPVICRIICEVVFTGNFGKPLVGFVNKAYMCSVVFCGIKGYSFELCLLVWLYSGTNQTNTKYD